jgi:hypothetical protein
MPVFRDGADGAVRIAPVTGDRLDLFSGWRWGSVPKDGARYSLDPADWLAHVCAIVGRDLTTDEWNRYLPERPHRRTCTDLTS